MSFCVPVDCGLPPIDPHAKVVYNSTTYRSKAVYTCDDGYEVIAENSLVYMITCHATGYWDDPLECKQWECPLPGLNLHLTMEYSSLTYLSTATYSCTVGYDIENGIFTFI